MQKIIGKLEFIYKVFRWYNKYFFRKALRKIFFNTIYVRDNYKPNNGSYSINPNNVNYLYNSGERPVLNSFFKKKMHDYFQIDIHPLRKLDRDMVIDGNWDIESLSNPIEDNLFYKSAIEVFTHKKAWSETPYFSYYLNATAKSKKNLEAKKLRLDRSISQIKIWNDLFKKIKVEGYKSQKELKIGTCPSCKYRNAQVGICEICSFNVTKDNLIPSHANYLELSEIAVHIGRSGEFIMSQGLHRLVYSKILKVDIIFINIIARHKIWHNLRSFFLKESEKGKINHSLSHPDLRNLPTKFDDTIFDLILSKIDKKCSSVIDFNNNNWDFFCNNFEDKGFKCQTVLFNKTHSSKLEILRNYSNKEYKINYIQDFKPANIRNSDVLLFLNFNEFLFDDKFIKKFLLNLDFTYLFFSTDNKIPEDVIKKLRKRLAKKNCDIISSTKLNSPIYVLN